MGKYILFTLLFLSPLVYGDFVLVYNMETDHIKYIYKNISTSKMVNNSEDGIKSVYVLDDNVYLVRYTPSGLKIINANNLKVKKRIYDTTAYIAKKTKPNYKIRKTKKHENIAGINGEVWMVFGQDGGQVYSQYVVVTNDQNVVKVMRNMFIAYSKMDGEILDLQNIFEIEPGYMLIKTDSMQLESFVEVNLDPSIYNLPKK